MSDAKLAGTRPLSQFLRMAVMAGVESAVQIHIARGDDLNARDHSGMTPLMLSAARNKPAICKLLLAAGADDALLDPSGNTAYAIALANGARESAAVLATLRVAGSPPSAPSPALDAESPPTLPGQTIAGGASVAPLHPSPSPTPQATEKPQKAAVSPAPVLDDGTDLDLSGWEEEEASVPPEGDPSFGEEANAVQRAISRHDPVDSSADWEDIDVYLPEQSSPLTRTENAEAREDLRLLLLRAIREGSVPSLAIRDLAINDDGSANPEAEALLTMVINDLGADVDERFEYLSADESFLVFVNPDETQAEEDALQDALAVIDAAGNPRSEPLRMYQREVQRLRLISAEEESELGKSMESAVDAALDALATWPNGVARTLAAGEEVKAGVHPRTWMSIGEVESDMEAASADDQASDASEPGQEQAPDSLDENDEAAAAAASPGDGAFIDTLARLASLAAGDDPDGPDAHSVRETLRALQLNRRFLLDLADVSETSGAATRFREAMLAYRGARDRMAAANLRLVFHMAKKYLFSGLPLEDLTQEGNIGLLRAVDRYDWRRGFRFSTYATWWIRQQIGRYVADKGRTVRVPVHIHDKIQRLQRETDTLARNFGRKPTLAEVAERMGMAQHKVAALQRIPPEPLPIHDLPVDELATTEARDSLAAGEPESVVFMIELRQAIDELLGTLPVKEQRVVRLRFGLGISDSLTLDEIGQRYGVTRERIRQIEAKALKRLRHPARSDPFARLALGMVPSPRKRETAAEENGSDENSGAAEAGSETSTASDPDAGSSAD